MTDPLRAAQLTRLIGRLERLTRQGTAASSRITTGRLVIFLIGLVCIITLYRSGWYGLGNSALAGFLLLFILVAAYHNRLEQRIHRLRLWHHIKTVHIARLQLDWPIIPPRQSEAPPDHLYAKDLDLAGPHSLLHLLDTTVSDHGHARLASWLLTQPPASDVWNRRQRLAKELAPRPLFRDRLTLHARLAGDQEINGRRLAAVLHHHLDFPKLPLILTIQICLAIATVFLGAGALLGQIPGYWMFSFGAYAVLYFMTDQGEHLLEHAVGLHHEMERLGTVLGHLERHARPSAPALADACAPLLESTARPSSHLKRATRTLHAISVKANPLLHLGLNALCPWDLWFTRRLTHVQESIKDHLPVWLDCLAEVEAASALANFAYLHPQYAWPTPYQPAAEQNRTVAIVRADRLGHPLLPPTMRVTNDFHLDGLGSIRLITGSNMSGKSTFLRTIGVNLCLAQAGAPVCATTFIWNWSRLACCIRVNDSLDAGLSFFYAEVKRLKTILDATHDRDTPPVLFLIDEIFKGTNNRERLIGSRAYIKALSTGHGFGLVSTHDLELTDLEQEIPSLVNSHFQETVSAGALQFDYQIRPGPCPTTNALRIMELEGLPVPKPSNTP
ncbi:MAG: MutS family DNA mismatch repair protein [Nitrospira sp.]|nr:MutS family DNA mismatch repair protein [Nitrospira sp.]